MRALTPREHRVLAVGLLLATVLGAAWGIAEVNSRMHARYDAAIEQELDKIARYQRIAAARGDYEAHIRQVKAKDAARFYLKSSAPALAAADIQQVVQTVTEANGLSTESMQIAPHKDEDGHRKVTLNVRLRGKLQGVQSMLYSLEATQPYLFVDNLNIQTTVRSNFVPTPNVDPDVQLQFDLHGYALLKKTEDAPARR